MGPADTEAATDTALAYPAKLTARERDDMAQQLATVPAEIAQQMLDVIASKLHGSQIRTNAAAVLRGMVRKYRADPTSFDPSPGFHITEQRRRRIEAEEQSRVEAAQRAQERETLRPAPELAEVRRHAIASMLRTLRGR